MKSNIRVPTPTSNNIVIELSTELENVTDGKYVKKFNFIGFCIAYNPINYIINLNDNNDSEIGLGYDTNIAIL